MINAIFFVWKTSRCTTCHQPTHYTTPANALHWKTHGKQNLGFSVGSVFMQTEEHVWMFIGGNHTAVDLLNEEVKDTPQMATSNTTMDQ